MEKEIIYSEIIEIINYYRDRSKSNITIDDIDKMIFGNDLQGDAYELLGVFGEIEKHFSIKITEEKIEKYGFRNIRSIGEMVFEAVNEKNSRN